MNKKTIYSPDAAAYIKGSSKYSNLHGVVTFKQTPKGVWVSAEIYGLPYKINVIRGYLRFIFTAVKAVREIRKIRFRMLTDIIIPKIVRIRIMPEICRRYSEIMDTLVCQF